MKKLIILFFTVVVLCITTKTTKAQEGRNIAVIQAVMLVKLDSAIRADDIKILFPTEFKKIIKSIKKSVRHTNTAYCAYLRGKEHIYGKNLAQATLYYAESLVMYEDLRTKLKKGSFQ